MKILLALTALLGLAGGLYAQQAPAAKWRTTFGLDERLRLERKNNYDFNDALRDKGGALQQRLKLSLKGERPGYELFAELYDLQVAADRLPRAAQDDAPDLHQAYVSVKGLWLDLPLELKIGRQELKYGAGRLLWAAVWNNRVNHLDAAVVKYKKGPLSVDAFGGARVSYDPDGWNDPSRHDILAGVYASYRRSKDAPLLEGYFLSNYDDSNLSTLNRRTVGLRAQARLPLDIAIDVELPYQFGTAARKTVSARAAHVNLSREFNKAFWSPRAMLAYNYASGDKDPADSQNNTFIPLYQAPHDPYGLIDLFRWQNMEEFAAEVSVRPARGLKVTAGTSLFWLAARRDSWYDSAGKKLRTSAAGTADPFVGQEVSLVGKLDLGGGLGLEGGYAHFYAGKFADGTGTEDDADLGYFQLTFKL